MLQQEESILNILPTDDKKMKKWKFPSLDQTLEYCAQNNAKVSLTQLPKSVLSKTALMLPIGLKKSSDIVKVAKQHLETL